MTQLGYHASHEQFPPSELLNHVQQAEKAGFHFVSSSDHFRPWTNQQGQSGFVWAWLGAAMQATQFPYLIVNAPGQRYHPAIIAQAAATLAELFPRRFSLALGSGQALNERITGQGWPTKAERNARLLECVKIIRALWAGETVTHNGLVAVEEAKLYTLPLQPPRLLGAAITAETARWVGGWADALITVSRPPEELQKVVDAFRAGGGVGKPMILKVQLSFDRSDDAARRGAYEQWRANILDSHLLGELAKPEEFESAGQFVRPDDLDAFVNISSGIQRHLDCIRRYQEMGFGEITLHNVNRNQAYFIEAFGKEVLPQFGQDAVTQRASRRE